MEGEIHNFIMVWTVVLICLCYCHAIARFIPTGNMNRLLAILPVVCLFCLLPLNLNTVYLGGITSFFVAWLANFKLLLFAFGQGPLSSNPSIPLLRFITLACLPITIKDQQVPSSSESKKPSKVEANKSYPSQETAKKTEKSRLNYVSKGMILLISIQAYSYNQYIHPKVVWFLYCIHFYLMLELILAMFAALARTFIRAELEPVFDEPYLTTSLQDFWGKRWNLMVSHILRLTVYNPVRAFCTPILGRKWAPMPALLVTFVVSGLMHELVFFNIGRLTPSGEVTFFFLINGLSLALEIGIKRLLNYTVLLSSIFSRTLTIAFVVLSSFWLFFPPLLRAKADVKICTEILAVIEFVKFGRIVSPNNLSCPFL